MNRFPLMRKVLRSCLQGRRAVQGGRVAGTGKYLGSRMVQREHLVPRPLGPTLHRVAFLGRLFFFSSGSCYCRAPALLVADLQRLVGENLGHLCGQRALGMLLPARAAAKLGFWTQPNAAARW